MKRIRSFIWNASLGQLFPQPMESWTGLYASPHRTGMGESIPKSFKYDEHPTSYVLHGESANDVSSNENPYVGQGHGFYQNPDQQPNFSWQPGASQTPRPFYPGYQQQPKLPFLAMLHLLDLTRLLNDPICHDPRWPPMLTKLPSDIPKFEAKPNEDPGEHVTTFHLWCSSNSLNDDSVQLRLFQHTLIGSATKWYIELDRSRYSFFDELAMAFLNHF
jgi:hypothetical protein